MFLVSTEYLKPAEEVAVFRDAHLAYFRALAERKKIVVGGRRADGKGAYIVYAGDSRAELDAILAGDPYAQHGCAKVAFVSEFAGGLLAPVELRGLYGLK